MKERFDAFKEDTRNELWDDLDALKEHLSDPDSVESYIRGDLGENILAKHKIILMSDYLDEVCEVSKQAIWAIAEDHDIQTETLRVFLEDLVLFEHETKRGVLQRELPDNTEALRFDLLRFLNDDNLEDLADYAFADERRIVFSRSDRARQIIDNNFEIYGSNRQGQYKALTRTALKNLYREARYLT